MNASAEAAIGAGDNAFAADAVGETQNALRHEFGMLDDVGGMADDAGQNYLVVRKLDVLPNRPLVLVADIAGFERIGLALHGQHDVDDIAHRDVGGVRAVPASPAQ